MAEPALPAQLLIRNASTCRTMLLALVNKDEKEVCLDGSLVTDIDTAGLQLLLALWRQAKANKQVLRIVRSSVALRQGLMLAGISDRFLDRREKNA